MTTFQFAPKMAAAETQKNGVFTVTVFYTTNCSLLLTACLLVATLKTSFYPSSVVCMCVSVSVLACRVILMRDGLV